MISPFIKSYALGSVEVQDIFDGKVEITEKIDGSQFAFCRVEVDGLTRLEMRSRGMRIYPDIAPKLFEGAVEHVLKIKDRIPTNITFYGEVLSKPKHNTIKYDRIPKNHIMLFGAKNNYNKIFYNHSWLTHIGEVFDLETVPSLYYGTIPNVYHSEVFSVEKLKEWLDTESVLGGSKIEGIVVKNYNKSYWLGGVSQFLMVGKLVRPEFKELNHKAWVQDKNKLQDFLQSFKSIARWEKAVYHLRDNEGLNHNPTDIGPLMKNVEQDVEEEEKENVKEFLWNLYRRDIMSHAKKGLAEWYKERLLNDAKFTVRHGSTEKLIDKAGDS